MDLEQAFLQDIQENPDDPAPWLILADWLHDRNDLARSELVQLTTRLRAEPRHDDAHSWEQRIQHLLAQGVLPVTPRLANSIGMELALIPAGLFKMGSPSTEVGRFEDEGPHHLVRINRPYYLGIYPVTQAQYEAITSDNPSQFHAGNKGGPLHPVEQVSWDDAIHFCKLLSQLEEEKAAGRVYRLPTEAEWEYACRAGTTSPFSFGASASSTNANFDGNHPYGGAIKGQYLQRSTPVGLYTPNAWGLYDMHGNVREWCADWYGPTYYHDSPKDDPTGPPTGEGRVQRGGSWGSFSWGCRSAFRLSIEPDRGASVGGFRVLMRVKP
jgi:uncharacterized protein (TIGR02996 family)